VPWSLWKRLWDAQTPSEVAELTGQVAPHVEALPASCPRRADRPGESWGRVPVLAVAGGSDGNSPAAPVAS
jgi:hypothetical protein